MDSRLPAKHRMAALENIERPSLNLLRRLLAAKSTPTKLRLIVARRYALEITRRELVRNEQKPARSSDA
jgi:hypothetical protein